MHYLCFSQGDEPPHLFSNRTWYCFPSSQQSSTSWTENSLERPPHLEYKGLFIDFCSLASSPTHRVVEGTYLDKNIGKLFQKLLPPSLLLNLLGPHYLKIARAKRGIKRITRANKCICTIAEFWGKTLIHVLCSFLTNENYFYGLSSFLALCTK